MDTCLSFCLPITVGIAICHLNTLNTVMCYLIAKIFSKLEFDILPKPICHKTPTSPLIYGIFDNQTELKC